MIDKPKEYIITHDKEELEDNEILEIKNNLEKIIKGYPIQYITKRQEFMGLDFWVDENVLIPQPDTEALVEEILNIAKTIETPKILDLCTGSGAIAISLKKHINFNQVAKRRGCTFFSKTCRKKMSNPDEIERTISNNCI